MGMKNWWLREGKGKKSSIWKTLLKLLIPPWMHTIQRWQWLYGWSLHTFTNCVSTQTFISRAKWLLQIKNVAERGLLAFTAHRCFHCEADAFTLWSHSVQGEAKKIRRPRRFEDIFQLLICFTGAQNTVWPLIIISVFRILRNIIWKWQGVLARRFEREQNRLNQADLNRGTYRDVITSAVKHMGIRIKPKPDNAFAMLLCILLQRRKIGKKEFEVPLWYSHHQRVCRNLQIDPREAVCSWFHFAHCH